jgi:SAM-dependent methyltransferase
MNGTGHDGYRIFRDYEFSSAPCPPKTIREPEDNILKPFNNTGTSSANSINLDPAFWRGVWDQSNLKSASFNLSFFCEPLLERYLPNGSPDHPISFLEIGCYPGRILYYFAKKFNYQVNGLDFLPEASAIPEKLAPLGVECRVMVGDFFTFNPGQGYDVVCSTGFVEHFPQWEEVVDRHLALLNPGGTLIITLPNFRYGQYLLRRFLTPTKLAYHYLHMMDPRLWRQAIEKRGLILLYCDYYETLSIWGRKMVAGYGPTRWLRLLLMGLVRSIAKCINIAGINYPNRYFSPFIVVIARKPEVVANLKA